MIGGTVTMSVTMDGMESDEVSDLEWTPAAVRTWATQQGIEIAQRGRIPEHLVALYLARPAVVREWARRQGIDIGKRGPLPSDLLNSYLARPAVVREWARRQGIDIGKRGRVPEHLIESYLERFGELSRSSAA